MRFLIGEESSARREREPSWDGYSIDPNISPLDDAGRLNGLDVHFHSNKILDPDYILSFGQVAIDSGCRSAVVMACEDVVFLLAGQQS